MLNNRGTYVVVGTDKGGYIFASEDRKNWKPYRPILENQSVNSFTYNSEDGRLYAATHTDGVYVSEDLGRNWRPINHGLHVRKVWTIAVNPSDQAKLYVGTHYGHLFFSSNKGESWDEVTTLHKAPRRNKWGIDWGFGTTGLCIHTICIDQTNSKRMYIVPSGNGTYRSDDEGKVWKFLQGGIMRYCPIGGSKSAPDIPKDEKVKRIKEHLNQVHMCTHKLVLSRVNPNVIYQQNHCGVYYSLNNGNSWTDISPSDSLRHGFAIAIVGSDDEMVYTVPAFQGICRRHNSCIKGQLAVYRGNRKREWKKLTNGLPRNTHTCVLRDSMTTDNLEPAGLYFGTITGELYYSYDEGESWHLLSKGLGRIQGVASFFIS